MPECIVEEWINQHDNLNYLYPNAINPLRIQTLCSSGKVHIQSATITIGNGTEIANASAVKAIFALVDVVNGIVCTDGCDYSGNHYKMTPLTSVVIKGFKIPFWKETIKMLEEAALLVPEMAYVGWDIAITPYGPIIIEGNNDAGYTGYQYYPLTQNHKGIKELYKDYI